MADITTEKQFGEGQTAIRGEPGKVAYQKPFVAPENSAMTKPIWKADLGSYREEAALKFPSVEAADAAIDLFWKDDDLYDMPRAPASGDTIIVPGEAVELLNSKGLEFTASKVRK